MLVYLRIGKCRYRSISRFHFEMMDIFLFEGSTSVSPLNDRSTPNIDTINVFHNFQPLPVGNALKIK